MEQFPQISWNHGFKLNPKTRVPKQNFSYDEKLEFVFEDFEKYLLYSELSEGDTALFAQPSDFSYETLVNQYGFIRGLILVNNLKRGVRVVDTKDFSPSYPKSKRPIKVSKTLVGLVHKGKFVKLLESGDRFSQTKVFCAMKKFSELKGIQILTDIELSKKKVNGILHLVWTIFGINAQGMFVKVNCLMDSGYIFVAPIDEYVSEDDTRQIVRDKKVSTDFMEYIVCKEKPLLFEIKKYGEIAR
ncbi:MAG: hypothetical protein PHE89_03225 [Alphaproteobacteria bacterium]|nr:hypothetical protein [Alphaproteobacteria bacterium]